MTAFEKRFQFFISSTFTDLKEERQVVLKAVIELNHMPAGMELFPASDDAAWQLIKDVINASDYYLLIIGGRYGSVDDAGVGFTEKEYDYAVQTRKPVIAFLHQDPGEIKRSKTETDEAAWSKLQAFRAKVEKKHTCVYWTNAEDLKAKVVLSVTTTMKRHPAVGWVRADQVPSGGTLADVLLLRNQVDELKAQLAANATAPPPGTEELAQGDDTIAIDVAIKIEEIDNFLHVETHRGRFALDWNGIFAAVAPTMITEASDDTLRTAFKDYFRRVTYSKYRSLLKPGYRFNQASFMNDQIETCIVQLRALGLIREGIKARSVKDTQTYWRLTPYGDNLMTQLRAIRRDAPPPDPEVID